MRDYKAEQKLHDEKLLELESRKKELENRSKTLKRELSLLHENLRKVEEEIVSENERYVESLGYEIFYYPRHDPFESVWALGLKGKRERLLSDPSLSRLYKKFRENLVLSETNDG